MIGMHVQFGGCLSIECPPFSKSEDEIGIEYPISRFNDRFRGAINPVYDLFYQVESCFIELPSFYNITIEWAKIENKGPK